MEFTVVVVAGGSSTRFGADKLAAPVGQGPGGASVLAAAVQGVLALDGASTHRLVLPVVVVGPPRGDLDGDARLTFAREDPPGSGPAAAVLAGAACAPSADVVVVVAGDAPFAATAVPRLLDALERPTGSPGEPDAAVGVDGLDRRQNLLLAVRRPALPPGSAAGRSARSLLAGLRVTEVPVTDREALDVDDEGGLERARQALREGTASS